MRLLNLTLGIFFLSLGVVGIFLPIIPTTGPLLLALWFFSRSSKRLHNWLVNHRILGKYVHDLWVRGGLTAASKRRAIIAMSAVILLSACVMPFVVKEPGLWFVEGGLGLGWLIATVYISTRKTLDPLPATTVAELPGENP